MSHLNDSFPEIESDYDYDDWDYTEYTTERDGKTWDVVECVPRGYR